MDPILPGVGLIFVFLFGSFVFPTIVCPSIVFLAHHSLFLLKFR